MKIGNVKFPVGLRTLKTVIAVVLAMVIVNAYGATTSRLIFATLGAMAAMEHTFLEAKESCLTQIVGVFFGALVSILLMEAQLNHLLAAGIGILFVITTYNLLHIRFSPSLPCLMVVILCTGSGEHPIAYAFGRLWDTAIGLGVGLLINMLVFPYDNRRSIRATAERAERELEAFLKKMLDSDARLSDAEAMLGMVENLEEQLAILSGQWTVRILRKRKQELEVFHHFNTKVRQAALRMEVLYDLGHPGQLSEENRQALQAGGLTVREQQEEQTVREQDVIINYHLAQLLRIWEDLRKIMGK